MRDWLSHRVTASPDAPAIVRAEDGATWTYAGLDRLVDETAGRLSTLDITVADRLGVVLPTSVGYVGLIHAAMRLGVTLVPLSERLTSAELGDRIERAELTAIVCSEETEASVLEAADGVPVISVDQPMREDVAELHGVESVRVDPYEWDREDPLCILFTSGTTGTPKAVDLRMGNVLASTIASAFRLGIDPDDRWLVTLSLHHMGGLAPIYRSTLYGTTVVLRESFDPGGAADDIDRHDVTAVSLVPTMLRRMLDRRGTLADSLRFVLLGGAPTPETLIDRCQKFSIPVCPTYGMTETASQIATARPAEAFQRDGSAGRPLLWTDITVVADDGEPVETGEPGELVVSGPTVCPGYVGDPEATDASFGEYGLHTGDVGYVDEAGFVYVLNRRDDRIITGGENVDPGEVVEALVAHPDVRTAAVVGLPDEEWGERVGALVVRDDEYMTAKSLLAATQDRLARFKLPRTVAFADELPRTVSSTVDRDAVRELLREDGFEAERPPEDGQFDDAGFESAVPEAVEDSDGDPDDSSDQEADADSMEDADEDPVEEADADSGEDADERDDEEDAENGEEVVEDGPERTVDGTSGETDTGESNASTVYQEGDPDSTERAPEDAVVIEEIADAETENPGSESTDTGTDVDDEKRPAGAQDDETD